MGKRKSKRKQVKKAKAKLDTQFTCLFCNHERSIDCKMDYDTKLGKIQCRICGEKFQTVINDLSENVDVYAAWVDACEAAN